MMENLSSYTTLNLKTIIPTILLISYMIYKYKNCKSLYPSLNDWMSGKLKTIKIGIAAWPTVLAGFFKNCQGLSDLRFTHSIHILCSRTLMLFSRDAVIWYNILNGHKKSVYNYISCACTYYTAHILWHFIM